jgi:hypothetical protein
LARRADEQLAGGAGLNVAGDRLGAHAGLGGMRALEVAKLDDLVADHAGVTVGDEQMPLALADAAGLRQQRAVCAGGENDNWSAENTAVGEMNLAVGGMHHIAVDALCACLLRLVQQKRCGGGRIEYRIAVDAQRPGKARAQVRLGGAQLVCTPYGRGNARPCVESRLALNLRHLFSVGGDPERACLAVFDRVRESWGEGAPELAGVAGQSPLCRRVIHRDDVPHACGRGAAAGDIALDDDGPQLRLRAGPGAGCAHDARAHDHHLDPHLRRAHDAGIPWRKGSSASKSSVVWPVI